MGQGRSMTLTKSIELGIDIDGKTAGCIVMPEFTQSPIYGDDLVSYTHKNIEEFEIHVWIRYLEQYSGIDEIEKGGE